MNKKNTIKKTIKNKKDWQFRNNKILRTFSNAVCASLMDFFENLPPGNTRLKYLYILKRIRTFIFHDQIFFFCSYSSVVSISCFGKKYSSKISYKTEETHTHTLVIYKHT